MDESRIIIDTDAMPWVESGAALDGGHGTKILRINDNFSYIDLFRAPASPAGVVGPPHVHIGDTEVFILSGEVETVAGTATDNWFVHEPAGALHRASKAFAGERALSEITAFNHVSGAMTFVEPDGTVQPIVFGQSLQAAINASSGSTRAVVSDQVDADAIYRDDYPYGGVDTNLMEWMPSGYDGVAMKVLKVYRSGRFTLLLRGDDGSVIPARKYSAPVDYFVLSGCLSFEDQDAPVHNWIYEPAGATEAPMRHLGETVYLATFLGAVADLSPEGGVQGVFDSETVRELATTKAGV
jgi:hypothetical protein